MQERDFTNKIKMMSLNKKMIMIQEYKFYNITDESIKIIKNEINESQIDIILTDIMKGRYKLLIKTKIKDYFINQFK